MKKGIKIVDGCYVREAEEVLEKIAFIVSEWVDEKGVGSPIPKEIILDFEGWANAKFPWLDNWKFNMQNNLFIEEEEVRGTSLNTSQSTGMHDSIIIHPDKKNEYFMSKGWVDTTIYALWKENGVTTLFTSSSSYGNHSSTSVKIEGVDPVSLPYRICTRTKDKTLVIQLNCQNRITAILPVDGIVEKYIAYEVNYNGSSRTFKGSLI